MESAVPAGIIRPPVQIREAGLLSIFLRLIKGFGRHAPDTRQGPPDLSQGPIRAQPGVVFLRRFRASLPQLATRSGLLSPVSNAWRFELPLAYRGIYTIQEAPGVGTMVLILGILSRKEYDRLFGYG